MEETTDGFVVAEKDLELRGAGEIMGTRQSGLPIFRVANLIRDQALLELARQEAEKIIENQANRETVAPLIEEVRKQPRFGLARIG